MTSSEFEHANAGQCEPDSCSTREVSSRSIAQPAAMTTPNKTTNPVCITDSFTGPIASARPVLDASANDAVQVRSNWSRQFDRTIRPNKSAAARAKLAPSMTRKQGQTTLLDAES